MSLIRDLSDDALLEEWWKWDQDVRNATSWSAALGVADEFRKECAQEIERRNLASHGRRTFS